MYFNTIERTKEGRIVNSKTVIETVEQWRKFYGKPEQFSFTVEDTLEWVNEQLKENEQLTRKQVQGVLNNYSRISGAMPFVKEDSENYRWSV